MNLSNYELQPEDVEKFCISCRGTLKACNLNELHIHYDEEYKRFHVNLSYPNDYIYAFRKLSIKEIFLISILL